MTHQLHPFMITRVVHNHTLRNQQARSPSIPPSLYQNRSPPPYINSHHDQLLSIPVTPYLAESLDLPGDNSQPHLSTITHTIYSPTRANHLFQLEEYSTSGHTIVSTITTTPTAPQPRVNGTSSGDTASSSALHQSRLPPCPR